MANVSLNIWYELSDSSGGSVSDTESHFGVLHSNGTAKPAYKCIAANMRRMRHIREVYVNTPVKMYKSTLTSLVLRTALRVR